MQSLLEFLLEQPTTAKIRTTKTTIRLTMQPGGVARSSMGFDALEVLAFDLAVLMRSVMENGQHPRFLIHDSPRTNDLNGAVYKRLFELVHRLEASFPPGQVGFQYIICTTTNPPDHLLDEGHYVVLSLLGHEAKNRLLGLHLGNGPTPAAETSEDEVH